MNQDYLIISNLDLNGNQLKNVALEILAEAPEAAEGRMYYDSAQQALGYYNGSEWVYVGKTGTGEHGAVSEVTKTDDVISVKYADGTVVSLSLTYASSLDDELTTPNTIGGIKAGTKVADLKKKTLSQMFDELLFEEVNPTIVAPSASISFKSGFSNGGIYEVGATAPTVDNFNTSLNRGTITVPGKSTASRAGALKSEESFVYYGGNTNNKELPATIALNETRYQYHAEYEQGDEALTSKGNKATVDVKGATIQNPLPAGSVNSNTVSVFGTYPYFSNGKDSKSTVEVDSSFPTTTEESKLALKKWSETVVYTKHASETGGVRAQFIFPALKKVTKVEVMNPLNGVWGEFSDIAAEVDVDAKDIQGNTVAYKMITTTGALHGNLQLKFTVVNR